MLGAKEFETMDQMKQYIVDQANHDGMDMLSIDDIVINPTTMRDHRCGWWDAMYVCTKRYGDRDYMKKYNSPQCIGMCATLYTSYDKKHWENEYTKVYG
jgi:hypothetical protein